MSETGKPAYLRGGVPDVLIGWIRLSRYGSAVLSGIGLILLFFSGNPFGSILRSAVLFGVSIAMSLLEATGAGMIRKNDYNGAVRIGTVLRIRRIGLIIVIVLAAIGALATLTRGFLTLLIALAVGAVVLVPALMLIRDEIDMMDLVAHEMRTREISPAIPGMARRLSVILWILAALSLLSFLAFGRNLNLSAVFSQTGLWFPYEAASALNASQILFSFLLFMGITELFLTVLCVRGFRKVHAGTDEAPGRAGYEAWDCWDVFGVAVLAFLALYSIPSISEFRYYPLAVTLLQMVPAVFLALFAVTALRRRSAQTAAAGAAVWLAFCAYRVYQYLQQQNHAVWDAAGSLVLGLCAILVLVRALRGHGPDRKLYMLLFILGEVLSLVGISFPVFNALLVSSMAILYAFNCLGFYALLRAMDRPAADEKEKVADPGAPDENGR